MSLTKTQGDLLLDLYEQCRVVSHHYDQKEAGRRDCEASPEEADSQAYAAAAQSAYDASVKDLTDFYVLADHEGVSSAKLQLVLHMGLPRVLANLILADGG